jgi:hypothetical protein
VGGGGKGKGKGNGNGKESSREMEVRVAAGGKKEWSEHTGSSRSDHYAKKKRGSVEQEAGGAREEGGKPLGRGRYNIQVGHYVVASSRIKSST